MCRGICKALNWPSLPENGETEISNKYEYRDHEAWSPYLKDTFGNLAATSFAIGSNILFDNLQDDIDELSSMPKGSHIGQIGA